MTAQEWLSLQPLGKVTKSHILNISQLLESGTSNDLLESNGIIFSF